MNLILIGFAVSNVFNGTQELIGSGGEEKVAKIIITNH